MFSSWLLACLCLAVPQPELPDHGLIRKPKENPEVEKVYLLLR